METILVVVFILVQLALFLLFGYVVYRVTYKKILKELKKNKN